MAALSKDENYTNYCSLDERPKGMEPWSENEEGELVICTGELFCRYNIADEDEGEEEVKFCSKGKFSHTGNLRVHVTNYHKAQVAKVHKGTSSGQESEAAKKFYKKMMERHFALDRPYDLANPESVRHIDTPKKSKAKEMPRERRPKLPLKKDGTVNKTQAKKMGGFGRACSSCKDVKKNCPDDTPGSDCIVWDFFTDESEHEI